MDKTSENGGGKSPVADEDNIRHGGGAGSESNDGSRLRPSAPGNGDNTDERDIIRIDDLEDLYAGPAQVFEDDISELEDVFDVCCQNEPITTAIDDEPDVYGPPPKVKDDISEWEDMPADGVPEPILYGPPDRIKR